MHNPTQGIKRSKLKVVTNFETAIASFSHRFDKRHDELIREAIQRETGLGPILETGIRCLECGKYISVLNSECSGDMLFRFKAS